jgi:hypothetical protein
MIEPVDIILPSGLRIMMYPKPAQYKLFKKVKGGETPNELYNRFNMAIRAVDFDALAKLYSPLDEPYQLEASHEVRD